MIYPRTTILAAVIAVTAAIAHPALADVYTVTYTGTAAGTDTYGLFGAVNAPVNNVAFSSTYTYDTSEFGSATQYTSPNLAYVQGGTAFGGSDPILSASITINGLTYYEDSSYWGQQTVQNSPSRIQSDAWGSGVNYLENYGSGTGMITPSITVAQSLAFSSTGGSFRDNYETLVLNDAYVTVADSSPPTPVPEPTSFALLAGAGAVFAAATAIRRTSISGQEGAQKRLKFA